MTLRDYRQCQAAQDLQPYGAEWPPTILPYPPSPRPLRLLFIGVNPPPGGGFWADDDDVLLKKMHWIFTRLAWTKSTVALDFRAEFRERGFYLIHTVKCFRKQRLPTRGKGRLIAGCAKAHLGHEITQLEPERICLLGNDPLEGVRQVGMGFTGRKGDAAEGSERMLRVAGSDVPVLMTYFPSGDTGRALLLCHLRSWRHTADIPVTP